MASSSAMLRANCSVIVISRQVCSPASAPQKTTSHARLLHPRLLQK